MIVPRYYEDLSVLHENTMPARAYFIPASKRMDNLVEPRVVISSYLLIPWNPVTMTILFASSSLRIRSESILLNRAF